MMVPTRRWLMVAAGLSLLAPLALVVPSAGAWLVPVDALWLVALLVDAWSVAAVDLREVAVARQAPPAFSVGRSLPVSWTWHNPTAFPMTILAREAPSRLLQLAGPAQRTIRLAAHGNRRETIDVRPVARGKETGGRLDIRIGGRWGLAWRQGRRMLPWLVTVYPNLKHAALRALPASSRRHREAGFRNVRRIGEGRSFESLNEWVPGEEPRAIDWKASARRGKLMARRYEDERRQQVMILIDAGRLLTAEIDGRARLESAIEATLELALSASRQDDNVGILVFADEVLQFVAPTRGRRAIRLIVDALAAVDGRVVESNYPVAFAYLAAHSRRRALTVLFTDLIDRTASDAVLAQAGALRPRHLPLAVLLRNPALERAATGRPATTERAYVRAAAEELLSEREVAIGQLRAAGVLIADVLPDQAAQAVVNQYHVLKRRALV
jgi:uncharacterized protein (DUF58 family)